MTTAPPSQWTKSRGTGGPTRVKLCEFEGLEAAYECCFIGADMLGFHIFESQDVEERTRRFAAFFATLPPFPAKTLLTDLPLPRLLEVLPVLSFDAFQMYAPCTQQEVEALRARAGQPVRILKVMSEKSSENGMSDGAFIEHYAPMVDALLLDSFYEGGTGLTGDWDHCAEIVQACPIPVFLAGGLTPDNVGEAIAKVRPFGVDVESGVGTRLPDGRRLKNTLKCRLFVEKVREADWRLGRLS
ncbi:MAG: phosphoribosylanthranilate isomerase [Myxococcota bacterium]